jgi:hypothetical protein
MDPANGPQQESAKLSLASGWENAAHCESRVGPPGDLLQPRLRTPELSDHPALTKALIRAARSGVNAPLPHVYPYG